MRGSLPLQQSAATNDIGPPSDFAQFLVANKLSRQNVLDQAETLDFPNS